MTSHRHHPTTPMAATLAIVGAALFEFDTTSADQEPSRMVIQFADPAVRSAWAKGLAAPRARERAWEINPHCVECGKQLPAADRGGLLATPAGHRVACKRPCFVAAVARINPTISTGAAVRRAGGLTP